jgi:cytoskeletal protein CcmA (bactofilin family)
VEAYIRAPGYRSLVLEPIRGHHFFPESLMWNREASQNESGRPAQPVSTTPARPEPLATVRPETERRVIAWVGKSVIFKGDLISSEDMSIDGRVEGSIDVRDHTLTIGPDANIHASIVAKAVIVLGTIVGSITARERVALGEAAVVEGDVVTPRLGMVDGAVLRGRVETTTRQPVGEAPGQLAAV